MEDGDADGTVRVDVWVVHLRDEPHRGRFERVVCREVQQRLQEEFLQNIENFSQAFSTNIEFLPE